MLKTTSAASRRQFLTASLGLIAAPMIVPRSALGRGTTAPSDRVTVGIIGSGSRAVFETAQYGSFDNCEIVALCDVRETRRVEARQALEKMYAGRAGGRSIRMFSDFRELLRQKDIDGVYIATPDHWHVPIVVAAAKAGKDIHCEKPLGVSVEMDFAARNALRKNPRVFQYGAERRSTPDARHAIELVLNGRIGKVQEIFVVAPGSERGGTCSVTSVPKGFDYNFWLGPAPEVPFCPERVEQPGVYNIYDYSLGMIANWAAHPFDQVQWWADNSGRDIPVSYEGTGKFDDTGLYNTINQWDVRCTYADGVVLHAVDNQTYLKYTGAPHPDMPFGRKGVLGVHNAAVFIGSEGWMILAYEKVVTHPASLVDSEIGPQEIHLHRSHLETVPAGLPKGQQQYATAGHHQDWIASIRSRKPTVDPIESAVRSDLLSNLCDVCVRSGGSIRWDPVKETVTGSAAARRILSRPIRAPWTLV